MNDEKKFDGFQDNIFGLEYPNKVICLIESYIKGHSILELMLYDPILEKRYRAGFKLVYYYSGPMRWAGANFKIRPWRESIKFLREVNEDFRFLDKMAEYQLQEFGEKTIRLYSVPISKLAVEIKILAGDFYIEEEVKV